MSACVICSSEYNLWDICTPSCTICGDCFLTHYVIYRYEFLNYPGECENCGLKLSNTWAQRIRVVIDNYFDSEYPMKRIVGPAEE